MNNKEMLERIESLEARNIKVDANKAWETSFTRKVSIMILTYVVVVIFLKYVVKTDPWINALVPVIGFFFSTLTVSLLKVEWLKRHMRK